MKKKIYDMSVKVGEYQDQNGQVKGNWLNIGAVFQAYDDQGHADGAPYCVLDRTFNPAGVPNKDNRGSVLVSLFEPKERTQ